MKTKVYTILAVLLAVAPVAQLRADSDATSQTQTEELAMAAENREQAAQAQQKQAEELMVWARELRGKDFLYEAERRGNFDRAGDAERKSGDLQLASAANYDRAAQNWLALAGLFSDSGEADRETVARSQAAKVLVAAREACGLAAVAYEAAAEAFGAKHADQLRKAILVSEKAAACRRKVGADPAAQSPDGSPDGSSDGQE